ncbi:tetratricopeptide repeat protein, partial [Thalassoroseus pseudoceratinae]|uniref:tetratricopeptide repeat protein n=1 Tax=Thalassoroseus pseudoceratinae TaxID=2713176 RepID=UPI001421C9FA
MKSSNEQPEVEYRFATKRFFAGILVVALLAGGFHLLRLFMIERNVGEIFNRAVAAEKDGRNNDALKLFGQYLQFRPDDISALERTAELLDQDSGNPNSWRSIADVFEKVLRLEPERDEIRLRLVRTLMKLGRYRGVNYYTAASSHIDRLLSTAEYSRNHELTLSKARIKRAAGQYDEAAVWYALAIDRDPQDVDSYAEFAALSRSEEIVPIQAEWSSEEKALSDPALLEVFPEETGKMSAKELSRRIASRMVQEAKPEYLALWRRGELHQSWGELDAATADIEEALELPEALNDSRFLLTAAMLEQAQARAATLGNRIDEAQNHRKAAKRYALKGTEAEPPEPRLQLVLSDLVLEQSRNAEALQEAEGYLRSGIEEAKSLREPAEDDEEDQSSRKQPEIEELRRLVESEVRMRWALADLFLKQAEIGVITQAKADSAANEQMETIRSIGGRDELTILLSGQLLAHNGQYAEAAKLLEQLRPRLAGLTEFRKRLDLLLASCYSRLQNPDRRIEIFRSSVETDPFWIPGRIELANALGDAGRIDEAIREYAPLTNIPNVAQSLARLVLLRELQKPADQRNLEAMEKAVQQAEKVAADEPATAVLRAELHVARNEYTAAIDVLEKVSKGHPDAKELWQAQFNVVVNRKDLGTPERAAAAEDLIAKAEKTHGDTVEIRLAKAELAKLQGPELLRKAVETLGQDVKEFTKPEQVRLYEGLVRYAAAANMQDQTRSLWNRVVSIRPDYLPGWMAIAELAARAGDQAEVAKSLKAVREIEGPKGPNGDYIDALWTVRQIAKSVEGQTDSKVDIAELKKELERPRQLLQRAAENRAYWAAVPHLQGTLEAALGNQQAAFAHYERARQLGDFSPDVVRYIVEYHRANKNFDLADAVIRQAEQASTALVSDDLKRLAWKVALERGQVDAAINYSRQLAGESNDFRDRIAHAHLLFAKYRSMMKDEQQSQRAQDLLQQARSIYREVVNDAPRQPEAWFAYVVFLWRVGDEEDARKAVEEAADKLPETPPHMKPLSLAQYSEVVQQPQKAAEYYRAAVEAAPDNVALRMAVADFFSRTKALAEADKHLSYLVNPENDVPADAAAWARRRRAFTTAARGRYEDVERALQMLRRTAGSDEVPLVDLRAQVSILADRVSLADRKQLIAILEQLRKRTSLSDSEMLRLASLYEQTDGWPTAKLLLEELLERDGAEPGFLSSYIRGCVKHEPDDDRLENRLLSRLDRLRVLEPHSVRTAVTNAEFDARFHGDEAARLTLTSFAGHLIHPTSDGAAEITATERVSLRTAAMTAEKLGLTETAESLYRQYAQASPRAEDIMTLATYLGRRNQVDAALKIVEENADRVVPEAAAVTAVNVVSLGNFPPSTLDRAEEIVTKALEDRPNSRRIFNAMAALKVLQKRFDEAELLYRRVLQEDQSNVAALNNLAWMLGVTGRNPEEAVRLINEAIAIAGPLADLVDTRGMIDLSRGLPGKAMKDLKTAFADTPTANIGYHLAVAYDRLDQDLAARKAFEQAQSLGLGIEQLHPTEHETYRKLLGKFDSN